MEHNNFMAEQTLTRIRQPYHYFVLFSSIFFTKTHQMRAPQVPYKSLVKSLSNIDSRLAQFQHEIVS
jgi:hypothetical protein